jgi:CsoR family transcriptional regulator, copper-sensing transcriptional repressor
MLSTHRTTSRRAAVRGYTIGKDDYLKRLRRIEGQVRGLQRMIEEDTYCIDVLTQVAAVTKALQSVSVGLLDEHVRHCVREAAASGDRDRTDEMVTEATRAIERLVKS